MLVSKQAHNWKTLMSGSKTPLVGRKEPTAFDYPPDGSGRDSYIINNFGLKANFKSDKYRQYEKTLRDPFGTPMQDSRTRAMFEKPSDATRFLNWPSKHAQLRSR